MATEFFILPQISIQFHSLSKGVANKTFHGKPIGPGLKLLEYNDNCKPEWNLPNESYGLVSLLKM